MPEHSPLVGAFTGYDMRLGEVADYVQAVMPSVVAKPSTLSVLVNGTVVLTVAYLDDFLRALVGVATPHREATLRKHFSRHGNKDEQAQAMICDVYDLVRMAQRRISFKERFARTEKIFKLMFDCPVWPSDSIRDVACDLVLVRNMIVHQGSADLHIAGKGGAEYVQQLHRTDVLKVTSWGGFTVYRIEPFKALIFYRDALLALQAQIKHLRAHLVESDQWRRL